MTKVMYLIEPIESGPLVLSPGLIEVEETISDEYFFITVDGYKFGLSKNLFIYPHSLLLELF